MKKYIKSDADGVFVWDGISEVPRNVMHVEVSNSVTNISDYAFKNCKSLKSIKIPNSVTSIGFAAFAHCESLTSITIPDSVTSIGWYAFSGCSALTNITISNSVTSIGYEAFGLCKSLTGITLPDSVTSIGNWAFHGCSSLTSITIPDSLTSIGLSAFDNCSSLASVKIPNSVTSISDYAFAYCKSLENVTIPDGVTSIGKCAFAQCESLESIIIPDSVTSIGKFAFDHCSRLHDVQITGFSNRKLLSVFTGTPFGDRLALTTPKRKSTSKFTQMRQAVFNDEIHDLVYDSEYSDYIDDLYSAAINKLKKKYPDILVEHSNQDSVGGVFATYVREGVTYRTHWDYEAECGFIEDSIIKYNTPAQVVDAIANFLDNNLEDAEPDEGDIVYI